MIKIYRNCSLQFGKRQEEMSLKQVQGRLIKPGMTKGKTRGKTMKSERENKGRAIQYAAYHGFRKILEKYQNYRFLLKISTFVL